MLRCQPSRGKRRRVPAARPRQCKRARDGAAPDRAVDAIRTWVAALVAGEEATVAEAEAVGPDAEHDAGRLKFYCQHAGRGRPGRFGGTHRSNNFNVVVDPQTGEVRYHCWGELTGHPPNPDGSAPRRGDAMRSCSPCFYIIVL